MSKEQVNFILNQTEVRTLVVGIDRAERILAMVQEGLATYVRTLITTSEASEELIATARAYNIEVITYAAVCAAGKSQGSSAPSFIEPTKEDVYILSYTSGTTGDSKGVKMSHRNVLANSRCSKARMVMIPGESMISYLPYTHSYEQMLFGFALINKLKVLLKVFLLISKVM